MVQWNPLYAPDFGRVAELQDRSAESLNKSIDTLNNSLSAYKNRSIAETTKAANAFLESNIRDMDDHATFDINTFTEIAQEQGADANAILQHYSDLQTRIKESQLNKDAVTLSSLNVSNAAKQTQASISDAELRNTLSVDALQQRHAEDSAYKTFYDLLSDDTLVADEIPAALQSAAYQLYGSDARAVESFLAKSNQIINDYNSIFSEEYKENLTTRLQDLDRTYKSRGVALKDADTDRFYMQNGAVAYFTETSLKAAQAAADAAVERNDILINAVEKGQSVLGDLATLIKSELGTEAGSAISYIHKISRDPQVLNEIRSLVRNTLSKMTVTQNGNVSRLFTPQQVDSYVNEIRIIPESTQLAAYRSSATDYGIFDLSPFKRFYNGDVSSGLHKANYRSNLIDFQVKRSIASVTQNIEKDKKNTLDRLVEALEAQKELSRKQIIQELNESYRNKFQGFLGAN